MCRFHFSLCFLLLQDAPPQCCFPLLSQKMRLAEFPTSSPKYKNFRLNFAKMTKAIFRLLYFIFIFLFFFIHFFFFSTLFFFSSPFGARSGTNGFRLQPIFFQIFVFCFPLPLSSFDSFSHSLTPQFTRMSDAPPPYSQPVVVVQPVVIPYRFGEHPVLLTPSALLRRLTSLL